MIGKVSGSSGNTPIYPIKRLEKDAGAVKVNGRGDASSASDTVEISKEAQALQKTVVEMKAELNKIPEVRADKVETARDRIQQGFYDTKEVINDTAEILLKSALGGRANSENSP